MSISSGWLFIVRSRLQAIRLSRKKLLQLDYDEYVCHILSWKSYHLFCYWQVPIRQRMQFNVFSLGKCKVVPFMDGNLMLVERLSYSRQLKWKIECAVHAWQHHTTDKGCQAPWYAWDAISRDCVPSSSHSLYHFMYRAHFLWQYATIK